MDADGQELGPYKPVSDVLVLAAIERATRHGPAEVWIAAVGEHLGFARTAHNTRRLRLDLERLCLTECHVERRERHGREYWGLTASGRGWLERKRHEGAVDELPESPQHRAWRHGRAAAADRVERFRELAACAVKDAEEVAVAPQGTHRSATWFGLAERLRAAFWLAGSATHCLEEWAEPDDGRPDTDPDPGPAPGRRVTSAWDQYEATAKEADR